MVLTKKTIPVLENPFSDPCYPREINLHLSAPAVVSLSHLRGWNVPCPPMFLPLGIWEFKPSQVSLVGFFVPWTDTQLCLMCLHSLLTPYLPLQRSAPKTHSTEDWKTSMASFVCKCKVVNNYILYAFVSVHLILKAVFVSEECALTEKGYANGAFLPGEGRLFTPCLGFCLFGWTVLQHQESPKKGVCIDEEVCVGTVPCLTTHLWISANWEISIWAIVSLWSKRVTV